MAEIVLDAVSKVFDDGYEAVKGMNLDIADGEFMILVGPSGCGKSTALRMIAGLDDISSGELKIGGDVVNDRSPKDRDIAMVFQNYALYPHMTVRENMGFALKLAKVDKEEIDRKVEEAAGTLDLTQHLDRRPANLSGGQRQRVAMGRAIVRDPKVFLMDEPLSNLDAKLRVQMRTEVSRLQSQLETTMVYVTHDQTEAMTLGDRVAVMRAGVLQQVGTPAELYDSPKNLFVAGFIGSPAMNFMPAELSGGRLKLPIGEVDAGELAGGRSDGQVVAGLRPENFEDVAVVGDLKQERGLVFEAEIDLVESLGSDLYAYFHIESEGVQSDQLADLVEDRLDETGAANIREGHEQVVARLDPTSEVRRGGRTELWADTAKLHLFDPETGESLTAGARGDGDQTASASGSDEA
ncbi:MAG TPA: sn-glycerol-3-phosphate ABC transporter ATP-binding protein UgpC [Solirubrobacterales bacterium]|jgi:multiple sugar transport system ATP-binding protein|nr:sn-glycerol-3-phosphate ABC transporter ATP-binding protein UgpC [Solirubrobacterales bacterium]